MNICFEAFHRMADRGVKKFFLMGNNKSTIELQWAQVDVGSRPKARFDHVFTTLSSSQYVLFGGCEDGFVNCNDIWIFDLEKKTWNAQTPVSDSPGARKDHSGIFFNNKFYIFGGVDNSSNSLDDFWSYDLASNAWTKIDDSSAKPCSRYGHTAVLYKVANRNSV